LAHYLVGFIVIVKGIEKTEHFNEHPLLCLSFFFIGGFILFANYRHRQFEKYFKEFDVILFLCEGLVLTGVSYYYFSEGKKALPYGYLVGAVVYFVVAFSKYMKKSRAENISMEEVEVKALTGVEEIRVNE
jgi:hypothetical protein